MPKLKEAEEEAKKKRSKAMPDPEHGETAEEEREEKRMKEDEDEYAKEDEDEDEYSKEDAIGRIHGKKKKKMKKEDEDEDDDDEDEMREPKEGIEYKDQFGGKDPGEEADAANMAGNTLTPNAGVPSTQNVMHGPMTANIGRNATNPPLMGGQSPSEVSYTGKSANPDLMKSPLFVELSSQIDGFQKAFNKKLEAVEKSVNDRLVNIQKAVSGMEKMYNQPFYKALNEGIPGAVTEPSLKDKFEKRALEFTK